MGDERQILNHVPKEHYEKQGHSESAYILGHFPNIVWISSLDILYEAMLI